MTQKYVRLTGDKDNPAEFASVEELEGEGAYRVTIGDESYDVHAYQNGGRVVVLRDGQSHDLPVENRLEDDIRVRLESGTAVHTVLSERLYKLQLALGGGAGAFKPELKSPMAGKVVQVEVEPGQHVAEGETLIIVEAMKMENEIRAEADVIIKSINVGANDTVNPGDVLITFEQIEEE